MICNNTVNSEGGMGSKRKALEMITNIFCKKSKECQNTNVIIDPIITNSEEYSQSTLCPHSRPMSQTGYSSCYADIMPKSPISPRVKNIRSDMEALMLSRQDNPYIMQQLERLSTKDIDFNGSSQSSPVRSIQRLSLTNLEVSPNGGNNFIIDSDISDTFDDDLHDKLIRSPPPQFPKNLSLFVYPNSSSTSIHSYRIGDNRQHSPSRLFLSPNLCHQSRGSGLKNGTTKGSKQLDPIPNKNVNYERRGSDSSILSNNWKTSFLSHSMAASSSSLLAYIPRCPASDSQTSASIDSNMSCNECQTSPQMKQKCGTGVDLMEIYPTFDDSSNQCMSSTNSREALIKDMSDDSVIYDTKS